MGKEEKKALNEKGYVAGLPNDEQGVFNAEVSEEMKKSYLDYAMSVIVSRAIPSIEDGLKPVQRRILYAMSQMGLKPNTPTKKSARVVGECFVKDTFVLTTRGLIPIQDIHVGDFVYTQKAIQQVEKLYEMPEKDLFSIILSNGISVTATPSQKFKILNKNFKYEWKEAKDLKEDEFLVVRADYPEIQENVKLKLSYNKYIEFNENLAYLLGQFLSGGWIEKSNRICFETTSKAIIERLKFILEKNFGYFANIEVRNKAYQTTSGQILESSMYLLRINNRFLCGFLAESFNLKGRKAYNKEIPHQILQSPKKTIYSFLSGLIDGDGHVHGSRKVIHYSSVSEKLIDGILLLSQQLGIMGKKYKSKLKGSYKFNGRVIKSNHFSVSIEFTGGFARKLAINLNLSEERKSERLKKILSGELKRSFFEVIPFSGNFIFSELSEKHLGSGWYRDSKGKNFRLGIKYLTGTKIRHFKRPKNIFLRKSQILEWNLLEKLKKINSAYYKFLRHIIDNKIYFLRVSKINKVKPEKTYDIQVRGDHEFVANGLISHNCLGKYHPHGDVAVYEALVRLAQDFSLRYPLVFGQGNFGSVDGDAPAAQRYTETRLQPIAMELIEDIEKETVEFVPNYDNSLKEPKLFPGKLPSLIINGAVGIAVGMATSIPSHNLTEVCDAIIAKIKNPGITLKELLEILSGPDFPTGGSVTGDMEEIYKTGRGKFIIRGKVTTEKLEKKNAIVISEIPYMVNKSVLITQIAQLISNKKIKDVVDLRDESSKGKIRVVLELRKEANSKFAINALYKFTRLQDSFNMNFLALVDDEPKVLNLQNVLDNYIKYRKNIVQRRIKFELKKAKERLEIVVGLVIALKDIDSVIKLIKNSKTAGDAASSLTDKYKLTSRQAQAVLDTKLHQLTSLEINKLVEEEKLLNKNIGGYNKILSDINEVLKIIVEEVKEIKKKFGDERKTKVLDSIKNISEKDLIAKKDVVITITDKGYCKRMDVKTYKEQKRGGRGVIGSGLAAEDFVKQLIFCSTHDYLMFFTTRGRVLWLKAYDIPAAERYSKGKALVNLLNLRDENITKVISLKNFEDNLFMATKKGMVKKISLKYFSKPRASGIKAINLPADNSDLLIGVEVIKKDQEVLLATRKGQAIRFSSVDIRNMGRVSYGVTGIKLERNDAVVSLEVLDTDAIITITKKGYGKRTAVKDYRKTARAGKGVINLKVTEKTGEIITTVAVNDEDNIIITTAKGMVIRTSLKNIRIMGRATQGVRLVKLQHGDYVTDLVKVPYAREVFEEE